MSVALAKVFASSLSVAARRFTLIALLVPVLAGSLACDPGPTVDDDAPGFATAAAEPTATRTPTPKPEAGASGSLTDPDEPCNAGCLNRWLACNKEARRRPGAEPASPDGGACAQAAAACLAACPVDPM